MVVPAMETVRRLTQDGLLDFDGERVRLTSRGRLISERCIPGIPGTGNCSAAVRSLGFASPPSPPIFVRTVAPRTIRMGPKKICCFYHASSSSPEISEKNATGGEAGCAWPPKHWMDSGPAALAHSRAFSVSRRTTTGDRPRLEAMPKHARAVWFRRQRETARKKPRPRRRSVSAIALAGLHAGRSN